MDGRGGGRTGGPLPAWATTQAGAVVVSTVAEVVAFLDRSAADVHGLIVVDDAERVDDHADALATLIARHDPNVLVACAGRPDALRTMYGHWTAVVRRSRLGLLLALGTDADGDLLGEVLPRRTPIPARRGLAWLVDADGRRLVQVAVDPPDGVGLTPPDSGARNRADLHENACGNRVFGGSGGGGGAVAEGVAPTHPLAGAQDRAAVDA